MKKIFAALLLLLLLAVAALAVTSHRFGKEAEALLRSRIDEWSMPGILDVELVEFDRGLFTSRATTRIRLDLPAAYESGDSDALSDILVHHVIHHGPLPFASAFNGEAAPLTAAAVVDSEFAFERSPELYRTLFGDTAPLAYRVVIGFDGVLDGIILGPALTFEPEGEPITVVWKGLTGRFQVVGDAVKADVVAPGLTLKGTELAFDLGEVSIHADGRTHPSGILFLGKREAKLSHLKMTGPGGVTLFAAESLLAQADQREENGAFNADIVYAIAAMEAESDKFGPFLCDVTLRKIDIEAMTALSEFLQEAGRPDLSEEEQSTLLEEKGIPAFVGVLKRSPEMEVTRLSLVTPMGELKGRMKIVGAPPGDESRPTLEGIERYVEADAELTLPRELLRNLAAGWMADSAAFELALTDPDGNFDEEDVRARARRMADDTIRSLITEHLVTEKNGNLYTHLEMSGGDIRVNGRHLELPASGDF